MNTVLNLSDRLPSHYDDRYSGGHSYTSGKLTSTNRNNPCPICQDTTRRCRIGSEGLVLCHQFFDGDSGAAGYRYIKPANNPRWGIHAPDRGRSRFDSESRRDWQERQAAAQAEYAADLAARLSTMGRHLAAKTLFKQLSLRDSDRRTLLSRGISEQQIEGLGYRSVSQGQKFDTWIDPKLPGISANGKGLTIDRDAIIFPIPSRDGYIIGWQYRQEVGAKYIWPKSQFSSHLQNGELPIGYYQPDSGVEDTTVIGLCEGFSKPPVAANLTGMAIIGAAGGNFAGSPQQMRTYLDGVKTAIIFADAGSIHNRNIVATYQRAATFCQQLGVNVLVAWYGQAKKPETLEEKALSGDIDEISYETYSRAEYLQWDVWLALCPPEIINKTVQNKPPDSLATNTLEQENLSRFSPEHSFSSRFFPEDFTLPEKANVIAIKGAKGTGKTVFLSKLSKSVKTLILTHRVCLEEDLANVFRLDSRHKLTKEGKLLGHALCINSLHQWANPAFNYRDWDGADLIMDEFDQMFHHLTTSGTCNTFKSEIINTWIRLMKYIVTTGGKIFLSSADLSDIHVAFIKSLLDGLPIEFFSLENTFVPYQGARSAYCHPDAFSVLASADRALSEGKRILFFTTSKGTGGRFATKNLETYFASKNHTVLRADSESVSTPNHPAAEIFSQQTTTQDNAWFDALREYDVLIATPVLETGVSIVGVYDSIYYVSETGVQTVESVGQSMARERANVPRHFYVPKAVKTRFGGGTKWLQIYNDQQDSAQKILANENNYALSGIQWVANPFHQLFCKMAALQNIGFVGYRDAIADNLRQSGYVVHNVTKGEDQDILKDTLKGIKETQHSEHCETVASAMPLTPDEKQTIQKKQRRTDIERERLERQEIVDKFMEPEVTQELVGQYERGLYEQARWHYLLTVGAAFVQMEDIRESETLLRLTKNQIFEVDLLRALKEPKLAMLHELGIAQFLNPENEFTNESLETWFSGILEKKLQIRKVLGISNFKQTPIAWVNQQLLSRLGLKLTQLGQRRIAGKRQRVYGGAIASDNRDTYFSRWHERDSLELQAFQKEAPTAAVASQITAMCLTLMRNDDRLLQLAIATMADLNPQIGKDYTGVRAEILALSDADKWELYGKLSVAAENLKRGVTHFSYTISGN